ncbi:MAG: GNAT family N-acetyltransferase [Lachnospiraceae bacterium]|nr:GNAT family N-acetyltransferase [Lachnospiraceae bacterium]
MDDLEIRQEQQEQEDEWEQNDEFPTVQLYSIGPREVDRAASLLTTEAVELIRGDEAFGLAIVEEDEVRGAVCARLAPENEMCLELLSLYVVPQYRRRRLGGTLLIELLEACGGIFDGTVARVEASFCPEPGLEALLKKAGFLLEQDEEGVCSHIVSVSTLADSPLMKHKAVLPKGCTLVSFEDLSPILIRQLFQTLEQADADYIDLNRLYQALPGASFVLLDAEKRPMACAVLSGGEEGMCLSQFFTAGGNTSAGMAVLQAAAKALLEQYADAWLEIPLLTASSAGLAKRLLGGEGKREPLIRAVLEL